MNHRRACGATWQDKVYTLTIPLDDGAVMEICSGCGAWECDTSHLTERSRPLNVATLSTGTGVPDMNAIAQAVSTAVKTWSPYQSALFDWAANGEGNIIVIAVAGSGKSTTGVEMTKRMRGSNIYLAFNRPIADELVTKGVNGRTFHSLCYSVVLRHFGLSRNDVVPNKVRSLLEQNFSELDAKNYGTFMTRLVGLARNAGIGCDGMAPDVTSVWEELAAHHDLEPDSDKGTTMERGIALARELMAVVVSCTFMVD